MTMKIQKIEQNGVIYADPAVPGLSIRFKFSEQGKNLQGVQVKNHVTEIIINDDNQLAIAGNNVVDAMSVRLRTSATAQSKARLRQLLACLHDGLDTWVDEDVFGGFRPVTPPVVTASE